MSKLHCLCGGTTDLSQLPNEWGSKIVPETTMERLLEAIVASHVESQPGFEKRLRALFRDKSFSILQALPVLSLQAIGDLPKCFGRGTRCVAVLLRWSR